MSRDAEWNKIEHQLANGLEDLYEELLILWNSKMYNAGWDEFISECRERYEQGRKQHKDEGSTWEKWSDKDFADNIREEIIDAVIYCAQRNATVLRSGL